MRPDEELSDQKLTVFYDGDCELCTSLSCNLKSSPERQIDLRNIHTENLPTSITKEAAEREMHVIDAEGTIYRNAAAIFKLYERNPFIRILGRLERIRFFKGLFQFGYRWVARHRHLLMGPVARLYWIKWFVCLGFGASLALSAPLWQSIRFYPTVPAFGVFPNIPGALGTLLFAGLFALLAFILFSAKPKHYIIVFLSLLGGLCLFDQSRWQPWVLDYGFLLVCLAFFSWKKEDGTSQRQTLRQLGLILGCIYFLSGLQKLNSGFVHEIFPWLLQPITERLSFVSTPLLTVIGSVVPFVEIGIGIGLLTRRFRRFALGAALLMHLFLLTMLGPLGLHWNTVVWPWNISLIGLNLLVFLGSKTDSFWDSLRPNRGMLQKSILLAFLILPLLSFINRWDSYLSQTLYSGNLTQASITFDTALATQLPRSIQPLVRPMPETQSSLFFDDWSASELKTPPYPETRVFKGITRKLCTSLLNPLSIRLSIEEHRLWGNHSPQTYSCADVLNK